MKKKATARAGGAVRESATTPIRGYAQRKLAEMHGTKPNSEFDDIAAGFDAGIEAMKQEECLSRHERGTVSKVPQKRFRADLAEKVKTGAKFLESAPEPAKAGATVMRSLGHVRTRKVDAAIEAYGELLATLRLRGDVLWFRANPIKLRLADETYYGPNFAVMVASGHLEMHHVMDAAKNEPLTTVKIAAEQFPFRFVAVHRDDSCGWKFEEC
ncbi:hypothetical protein ABXK61_16145 [Burkholderia sola]|uniref:hypothetical protein n=1 Tax=Burkholderia TaxID=32008 RepID=UPI001AE73C79|nr:hypothetical protein [Burkholderia sp. AcTa6-5]MBP0714837.1 hypothetical protein [Burkholderia sp. AcTa6-5]